MEILLNIFEFLGLCVGVVSVFMFYFALMPYAVIKLIIAVVRATINRH